MSWSYDYKNRLPYNHFAFCDGQGICRLPIFDIRGKIDPTHLRNAISRLPLTKLPDERVRAKIHNALEDLLDRMNAGESITADEWTPITTTKLFANPKENKMKKYIVEAVYGQKYIFAVEAPSKNAAIDWVATLNIPKLAKDYGRNFAASAVEHYQDDTYIIEAYSADVDPHVIVDKDGNEIEVVKYDYK